MDFKSLISKIESIDGKINTPKAPELPKSVQLNEDAQLRVLSGQTTYVSEAKKKKDEEVKEADDMKVGDKKNIATGTVEKTKTGIVHKSSKAYGGSEEKEADEDDKPKKKAKKESVEPEFKSKFMKMVEAKKAEEAADKKKKIVKKEKMAEGGLPMTTVNGKKVPAFAADGKGKNDLGKGKNTETDDSDESDEKDSKGLSAKQKKLPPGLQKAIAAKSESKIMPKGKKKTVKESVETKMSFKEMVQLVQESGGQQQIDPVDKALFTWAERVAKNKLGEGMKADLYAGLVYERNGGEFEMYDVLSETQE